MGVERNHRVNLYIRSVAQDYCKVQYRQAKCYQYGVGVKENKDVAMHLYEQAAQQGPSKSPILSYCKLFGKHYGRRLLSKAITWHQKAANQGHAAPPPHAWNL